MLYNITKGLIEKGRTAGLRDKIGVLFLAGSLTEEEYNSLIAALDAHES